MNAPTLYERLAIIGLGLIGSSLARAVMRYGIARHLVASDRDPKVLDRVKALGIAHSVEADPARAAADADLVVLATPIGTYAELGAAVAPALKPGAILSDVGSVKGAVIRILAPLLAPGIHLVPAHPVAGTEHSGPDAGFVELFENRWLIITPPPGADQTAVDRVAELWRRTGMRIEFMDAAHHDLVLAITSHLPHLIAYNIVGTADDLETVTKSEVIKYAAGGFRDFTRIAASDPVMWRDVFLNNREAVLEMLGRFTENLAALQRAIRWSDGVALEALFTRTRAIRRSIVEAGQADPEEEKRRQDAAEKAKTAARA
ncbi:MAG: prephenate/arogenate dehydrogenase family protein [Alphaproteobacteria bacterium]|nr:prephenate/arogenate dehydrogenase family protein [Alphaproteobacteria bacterium]